jgi:hypothetical protein
MIATMRPEHALGYLMCWRCWRCWSIESGKARSVLEHEMCYRGMEYDFVPEYNYFP